MIQPVLIPVLDTIEVQGYALYRPTDGVAFVWQFSDGPNALVGVNGLGKSTLVTLLFRLLAGPFDLNRRALEGELGQPDVDPVLIADRRMFARRVSDQARNATARLMFRLGDQRVSVVRRLSDLTLTSLTVDGVELPIGEDDRDFYHTSIAKLMRVGSFFDVLLILRFLVFVFEDRRSLVWDESAQRQIFRAVLSQTSSTALRSLSLQREIVEEDSAARNIRVQVNKARKRLDEAVRSIQSQDHTQAELYVTEQTVQAKQDLRSELVVALENLEDERFQERRLRMRAEHERDRLLQELDGTKLRLIATLFSHLPPVAQLALSRVVEDRKCACCGQIAPMLAEQVDSALETGRCPYCEQVVVASANPDTVETLDKQRIEKLSRDYRKAAEQADASGARLSDLDEEIKKHHSGVQAAERDLNSVLMRQSALRRSASVETSDITSRRVAVDTLTELMDEHLSKQRFAETELRSLIESLEEMVRERQEDIADSFHRFSSAFMRELCSLTYIARDERIGQEGARFRFPAFQVALSGGAVAGETLRDRPDAVSLSQREFIDIAFRMAILDVIASENGSSLIVDTPEAGLDFLFAERAGQQFRLFAPEIKSLNRVIVTSNLVSNHLLNALLEGVAKGPERRARLLNLIEHAAPTAAVRFDADRYSAFIAEIAG